MSWERRIRIPVTARDATSRGLIYFERDILAHNVNILNIHALEYTGYVAHICDMKSYFDENLKLTDDENLERYLGLSVLGNIPNADGKKPGKYGYYKTYAAYKTSAKQEVEDK